MHASGEGPQPRILPARSRQRESGDATEAERDSERAGRYTTRCSAAKTAVATATQGRGHHGTVAATMRLQPEEPSRGPPMASRALLG